MQPLYVVATWYSGRSLINCKFIQRFNRLVDCFIDLWRLFVYLCALPSPMGQRQTRECERESERGEEVIKAPLDNFMWGKQTAIKTTFYTQRGCKCCRIMPIHR